MHLQNRNRSNEWNEEIGTTTNSGRGSYFLGNCNRCVQTLRKKRIIEIKGSLEVAEILELNLLEVS